MHQRLLVNLLNVAPDAFRFIMSLMMRSTFRDPTSFYRKLATQVYKRDAELLSDVKWQQQLGGQLKHRLMGGVKVYVQEYLLLSKDWSQDLGEITPPTLIWHGDEDRLVDYTGIEEFSSQFSDHSLQIHSGHGHFMVCDKWVEFVSECVK
ncbi:hypothetical protein A9Q99_10425 [Gammaproteobacteria bacterium 45_16_T64]|nr:hypothetical protein A9Q99_10425 [Gammaproteobacteria bacterium 45_16_T64]